MDAERADEAAVLDQQRTDIRADSGGVQRRSLLDRVRLDRRVADRQGAAGQDFLRAARTKVDPGKAGRLWWKAVEVFADHHAVVAVDLAVADAIHAQVRA